MFTQLHVLFPAVRCHLAGLKGLFTNKPTLPTLLSCYVGVLMVVAWHGRAVSKQDLEKDCSSAGQRPLADAWGAETQCGGGACHGAHQIHAVSSRHHGSVTHAALQTKEDLCEYFAHQQWSLGVPDVSNAVLGVANHGVPFSPPPLPSLPAPSCSPPLLPPSASSTAPSVPILLRFRPFTL